jgi:hypothetical protein
LIFFCDEGSRTPNLHIGTNLPSWLVGWCSLSPFLVASMSI